MVGWIHILVFFVAPPLLLGFVGRVVKVEDRCRVPCNDPYDKNQVVIETEL